MTLKHITVGGQRYKIKYVQGLMNNEGESLDGLVLFEKRIIYIDKALPPSQRRSTLLHELLHICLEQTGLQHPNEDDEEHLVRCIEYRLAPLLKRLV